tara:strand:- start:127 stop:288 length:162 start_codon:yes stop_codon:yes gene_type:complete
MPRNGRIERIEVASFLIIVAAGVATAVLVELGKEYLSSSGIFSEELWEIGDFG